MRTKPVGTGPFKFVEFKRGDSIRLVRNPDYFKKDRPYLDEITVRTIDSRATRMLAFSTGDYDITFPSDVSIPLMKDVKARAPNAICEVITTGTLINLMVNRVNPPFDNPDMRKAMSLALDRKPFNTILMEGTARLGGANSATTTTRCASRSAPSDHCVPRANADGPSARSTISSKQARARSTAPGCAALAACSIAFVCACRAGSRSSANNTSSTAA